MPVFLTLQLYKPTVVNYFHLKITFFEEIGSDICGMKNIGNQPDWESEDSSQLGRPRTEIRPPFSSIVAAG